MKFVACLARRIVVYPRDTFLFIAYVTHRRQGCTKLYIYIYYNIMRKVSPRTYTISVCIIIFVSVVKNDSLYVGHECAEYNDVNKRY